MVESEIGSTAPSWEQDFHLKADVMMGAVCNAVQWQAGTRSELIEFIDLQTVDGGSGGKPCRFLESQIIE